MAHQTVATGQAHYVHNPTSGSRLQPCRPHSSQNREVICGWSGEPLSQLLPAGTLAPRNSWGRVRPCRPSLGVGGSDLLPSPTPPPAPAQAPPLSGAAPRSGPLGPDLT